MCDQLDEVLVQHIEVFFLSVSVTLLRSSFIFKLMQPTQTVYIVGQFEIKCNEEIKASLQLLSL